MSSEEDTTGNAAQGSGSVLVEIKPASAEIKIILSFDDLKGSANYNSWSKRMQRGLDFFDLWEYVTGELEPTQTTSKADKKTLLRNDFKAYMLITSKIDSAVNTRVQHCQTSKELWDKLESQHKLKGSKGQTDLLYRWGKIRLKEGGDVAEYLSEHDTIRAASIELGLKFGDTFAALQLLMGLPPSWDAFRTTLETGAADREEELDYDHVQEMISQEDQRRAVTNKVARNGGESSKHKSNNHRSDTDQAMAIPEKDAECYQCGHRGHYQINCHTAKRNYKRRDNRVDEDTRESNDGWKGRRGKKVEAEVASDEPLDFAGTYLVNNERRRARSTKRKSNHQLSPTQHRTLNLADVDVALAVPSV